VAVTLLLTLLLLSWQRTRAERARGFVGWAEENEQQPWLAGWLAGWVVARARQRAS